MRVEITEAEPSDVDLVCVGIVEDSPVPEPYAGAPGAVDVRSRYRHLATLHPDGNRVIAIGLGSGRDLTPERLRVAAAIATKRAAALEAGRIAWILPGPDASAAASALVEGTILAAYRFDRFRTADSDQPAPDLDSLTLICSDPEAIAGASRVAEAAAHAANRTRDLQLLPANLADPELLADRAGEIASAHDSVTARILGPEELGQIGAGGILGVASGSEREPRLIALAYSGGRPGGATIGLVGKGVTFDSGGLALKPRAAMADMKKDMTGAAAVLEGICAVAELGLEVNLLGVVPAVENMPGSGALRPGDVITQLDGQTVEVSNPDAEGRLILADAITWAVGEGVDRIVDLATLTGGSALGSTYTPAISNDDSWCSTVLAAADIAGEPAWRLPLHDDFREMTKGSLADLVNSTLEPKAATIYAGAYLERFVAGRPWVHLDIAGTSWGAGRDYLGDGATGVGARTVVRLAEALATSG